jgi:hypothetical protein
VSQSVKYVGNAVDPDRKKVLNDEPVSQKEFSDHELSTFRCVFSNEVSLAIRQSVPLFRAGPYCNLSAQQGAFCRLEEMLKASKFEIVNVTRSSYTKDEAMFRVQVRVPVLQAYYKDLFKQELKPGTKGYALVSFYVGVCKEQIKLLKKNVFLAALDEEVRRVMGEEPDRIADPAFDPERIFPGFLKNMRLERRFHYLPLTPDQGVVSNKRYYQSREGFYYLIEVDGFAALTS